tara:strand:+ start:6726 stop:7022 length:297 start_codon:yes stop_codon:yes gene_type:complete
MPYHKDTHKIKYNLGDILEVKTFAGPKIYQKVKNIFDYKTKISGEDVHVKGFEGSFTRRKDLYALKKSSVPYSGNEKLSSCISFTYDYQIIKVIKRNT